VSEVIDFSVSTPDGRRLAARISGPSEGPIVLYLGGTPGTLTLFEGQLNEGERRGLRHLIYLRPGYFGSDRVPGRTVASCATDVTAVLDRVEVDEVFLVGHSGGGPHATACATLIPDRIRAVAILASPSPREGKHWWEWLGPAGDSNKEEFAAIEAGDGLHKEFLFRRAKLLREAMTSEQLRDTSGGLMSPADHEAFDDPRFLAYQLECRPLAVQGGVDGWFDDNKAVWEDWGFDLRANAVRVTLWHGDDDRTVPYVHGERLERQMANATLRRLEGEGHVSCLVTSYGKILERLTASV
jgi:pimeloyl-ACP methyl ester carboxylesterase